jgi:hypothetical protein
MTWRGEQSLVGDVAQNLKLRQEQKGRKEDRSGMEAGRRRDRIELEINAATYLFR